MLRNFLAVTLTVLILFASSAFAQNDAAISYDEWGTISAQAEKLSNNSESSNEDLAAIRKDLVEWREKFQIGQNANEGGIENVKAQIEALGPKPAEGETEAEDIAKIRGELEKKLSDLEAPRIQAKEATSHADNLIHRIDTITSERQAMILTTLSPSPLLPSSWAAAVSDGTKLVKGITTQAYQRVTDADIQKVLYPNLPHILGYLAGALLLLTLGRHWVEKLPSRLSAHSLEYSRAVVAFAVSLSQIALPLAGIYLLVSAVKVTGIPGEWTLPLWNALPMSGLILFTGTWISRQLFPSQSVVYQNLWMQEDARNSARRMTNTLAVLFSIHHLLSSAILPLSGIYERVGDEVDRVPLELSDGTVSVFNSVMIVLTGLALFRLGNALRRIRECEVEPLPSNRYRITSFTGVVTRFVVLAVFLLAALGFINLANGLLWPWLLTITLFGVLILLKDFTADLYRMIKRGEEGSRDELIPMLLGFGLIILSFPLFLLIWGARGTDLAELWNNFREGFSVGGITISPGGVLTLLIVFMLGYSVTRGLQSIMRSTVLPKTKLDPGGQNAIVSGLGYVGIFLAALLAITAAGIDMSSLAIVAGALSVGIGFGLQNIVSNFVSGIILLIERPVSVGDWISAGGQQGIVKRISVRSTQVETFDKTEVIVPNSDLISQPVTNWTRQNALGRIIVPVRVPYGTDTRRVEAILQEIIDDQPLATLDPAPFILLSDFGPNGLEFEVRAVLSDVGSGITVASNVRHEIARRFGEEGISIPVTQNDVWMRKSESVQERVQVSEQSFLPSEAPAKSAPRMIPDETAGYDDGDGGDGDGDGR